MSRLVDMKGMGTRKVVGAILAILAVLGCIDWIFQKDSDDTYLHGIRGENANITSSTLKLMKNDIVQRQSKQVIRPRPQPFAAVNGSYPTYQSLLSVIEAWNPDHPDPPETFKETLMHFNFSDPYERQMAEQYRNEELPFKLYDVPEVDQVVMRWTDSYLTKTLRKLAPHVEQSTTNHFMFWNMRQGGNKKNYNPPTSLVTMSFTEFLKFARKADDEGISPADIHYYYMVGTGASDKVINEDLTFFSTKVNNFFITNVEANKGIQCRFGMRGVIAEAHYDAGRNMVGMFHGSKRYILNPPRACSKLAIITDITHPSYRHSVLDWSDMEQAKSNRFDQVQAIDTIVRTGEVLYIPSYW